MSSDIRPNTVDASLASRQLPAPAGTIRLSVTAPNQPVAQLMLARVLALWHVNSHNKVVEWPFTAVAEEAGRNATASVDLSIVDGPCPNPGADRGMDAGRLTRVRALPLTSKPTAPADSILMKVPAYDLSGALDEFPSELVGVGKASIRMRLRDALAAAVAGIGALRERALRSWASRAVPACRRLLPRNPPVMRWVLIPAAVALAIVLVGWSMALPGREQEPQAPIARDVPAAVPVEAPPANADPSPGTLLGTAGQSGTENTSRLQVADGRPSAAVPQRRPAPRARTRLRPAPAPTARAAAAPAAASFVGSLEVVSEPEGATVIMNGQPVGTTPLELEGVRAGSHALTVDLDGYRRWSTAVTVVSYKRNRISPKLLRIAPTDQ
jgi:hypothetical protein